MAFERAPVFAQSSGTFPLPRTGIGPIHADSVFDAMASAACKASSFALTFEFGQRGSACTLNVECMVVLPVSRQMQAAPLSSSDQCLAPFFSSLAISRAGIAQTPAQRDLPTPDRAFLA